MRIIFASLLTTGVMIGLMACGSDTKPATNTGGTTPTFANVQATLLGSCGQSTCHGTQKTATTTLLSETDFQVNAVTIQDRISANPTGGVQMPENGDWGGASAAQQTAAKAYLNSL